MRLLYSVIFLMLSCTAFAAETYVLQADKVTQMDNSTYSASGNVTLKVRDISFSSDNLTYNSATNEVYAEGNVKINSPTQKIEAEEFYFNTKTEQGKAKNIKGFLAPFNYICAASLEKTGETTFTVQDARISTCSGNIPDWSFSMYSGKLEIGGYLNAEHATANILNSPIAYFPKLIYPVSNERQSGFLMPNIGLDSEKGAFINLKYFWAPRVDFDMTFGLGFYTKSGLQEQIELQYANSADNNFFISFDRIEDATSEADTSVRWKTILKNSYVPFKDMSLHLNANMVSDSLYTRDFKTSGFITDLNVPDLNKENMFYTELDAAYKKRYFNADVLVRQDQIYRDTRTGYNLSTLQQSPSINLSGLVTEIPFVIVGYDVGYNRVEYKNYQKDSTTRGYTDKWKYDRFHAQTELFVPIDVKIATITPTIMINYTRWMDSSKDFTFESDYNTEFGGVRAVTGNIAERFTGTAGVTISFREVYKKFKTFRHSMQNNIIVAYSPELTQAGLPNFLPGDYFSSYGSATYEFINILVGKNWNVNLTLKQPFNFMNHIPAQPLDAKLAFSLFNTVTNSFEMLFKHTGELENNESSMLYFNNTLTVNVLKYFSVFGTYSYDTRIYTATSFNTSTSVGGTINIWRFKLGGEYKWQGFNESVSFDNLIPLQQKAFLMYNAECWSLGVEVEANVFNSFKNGSQVKRQETIFYISFSLKGLGDSRMQFLKYKDTEDGV